MSFSRRWFTLNKYEGRLAQFQKDGFSIKSGVYNLEIKDRSAHTLLTKKQINVRDGEVIAIEF